MRNEPEATSSGSEPSSRSTGIFDPHFRQVIMRRSIVALFAVSYALLVGSAGGMFGFMAAAFAHSYLENAFNLHEDEAFAVFLVLGICLGLAVAGLTYRQRWFHLGCVLLGSLSAALSVVKALDHFELSRRRTGTAGLGETILGLFYLILATAFLLLVIAGAIRLIAARRQRNA